VYLATFFYILGKRWLSASVSVRLSVHLAMDERIFLKVNIFGFMKIYKIQPLSIYNFKYILDS